jgi:hypothetical protein
MAYGGYDGLTDKGVGNVKERRHAYGIGSANIKVG